MRIVKTYKFKLYRQKKNKLLHQQINIAGLIYNHCIAPSILQADGQELEQIRLDEAPHQVEKACQVPALESGG